MIQCIDVVKRYGDKTVLNRISVSFEKGLIHGIVGRDRTVGRARPCC